MEHNLYCVSQHTVCLSINNCFTDILEFLHYPVQCHIQVMIKCGIIDLCAVKQSWFMCKSMWEVEVVLSYTVWRRYFSIFATLWFTPKWWIPEMFVVSLIRKSDKDEAYVINDCDFKGLRVYLGWVFKLFVLYYIIGVSRPSLLRESTDSMILQVCHITHDTYNTKVATHIQHGYAMICLRGNRDFRRTTILFSL